MFLIIYYIEEFPNRHSVPTILVDLEYIIYKLKENKKNLFRPQITNVTTNFLHKSQTLKDRFHKFHKVCQLLHV